MVAFLENVFQEGLIIEQVLLLQLLADFFVSISVCSVLHSRKHYQKTHVSEHGSYYSSAHMFTCVRQISRKTLRLLANLLNDVPSCQPSCWKIVLVVPAATLRWQHLTYENALNFVAGSLFMMFDLWHDI